MTLLLVILTVSTALNVFLLACYRGESERNRRLERDRRIDELERDLLPAVRSMPDLRELSPLMRLAAAVVGVWAADRIRRRY